LNAKVSSIRPIRRASSRARSAATSPRTPAGRGRSSTALPATTSSRSRWCSPNGTPIRTGGRTTKNVTGYDLRRLFTGAEGTLGTITEITLKLLPKPRFARAALAVFDRIDDAARTVTAVMARGIVPTAIELLDALTMRCVEENEPLGLPLDADAILIFGADGNDERVVDDEIASIGAVAREHGARSVTVAASDAESERLWRARRSISPALARRRPNKLGEDICVPRSKIPAMVARVREIAQEYRARDSALRPHRRR
jgi:glycolate oxidase